MCAQKWRKARFISFFISNLKKIYIELNKSYIIGHITVTVQVLSMTTCLFVSFTCISFQSVMCRDILTYLDCDVQVKLLITGSVTE